MLAISRRSHVAQRRCHIHLLRGDTRSLGESPLLETLEIVVRVSVCIHAFMHACIPRPTQSKWSCHGYNSRDVMFITTMLHVIPCIPLHTVVSTHVQQQKQRLTAAIQFAHRFCLQLALVGGGRGARRWGVEACRCYRSIAELQKGAQGVTYKSAAGHLPWYNWCIK